MRTHNRSGIAYLVEILSRLGDVRLLAEYSGWQQTEQLGIFEELRLWLCDWKC